MPASMLMACIFILKNEGYEVADRVIYLFIYLQYSIMNLEVFDII